MADATKLKPNEIAQSFENMALIWGNAAKYSAEIAHARRVLFNAYLAEGFTEMQALDLCKSPSF